MIAHNLCPTSINMTTPDDQEEAGECVKLIRKLRWVGLEKEAEDLEEALRTFAPNARGAVLAEPICTD